eukprot:1950487-Prymnesium_polylepis.1
MCVGDTSGGRGGCGDGGANAGARVGRARAHAARGRAGAQARVGSEAQAHACSIGRAGGRDTGVDGDAGE